LSYRGSQNRGVFSHLKIFFIINQIPAPRGDLFFNKNKMKEMIKNLEIDNNSSNYQFNIIKPGGNDTCIITGKVDDQSKRKELNDLIMSSYPNVEQVGFLSDGQLNMAGGEFCGNATRSSAFLILDGKPGEIRLKVSGVKDALICGVNQNLEAYAQMPIYSDPNKITPIRQPNGQSEFLVEMEGISHLITFNTTPINGLSEDEIKRFAKSKITELNLDKLPAAGVIFTQKQGDSYQITPVVYVRDINTLFLETACGSGTTALGLVLSKINNQSISEVPILQPSGMNIKVSIDFDGQKFKEAFIEGPIKTLSIGEIYQGSIIKEISNQNELETAFNQGLIDLYIDVFSQPPYEEKFSPQEVTGFFQDFLKSGNIFICKDKNKIIGFSASTPLRNEPEVYKKALGQGLYAEVMTYFAELGVSQEFRKKGIGKKLTEKIINYNEYNPILVRTSENNLQAISIYQKLGFEKLPFSQEVTQTRIDGKNSKDRRVFYLLKNRKYYGR
jgi:histidine racemase